VTFRSARYVALGLLAVLADAIILAASALGAVVFGVGGFGFGSGEFLMLAALCVGGCILTVVVGFRLIMPLVRYCLREARGL
jgi:hypothetical protein